MISIELASPVAKKLKVLMYGPSGSGKTLAALSFPRVLLVDAESGADLYAGRPGVPAFHRVRCKTLMELNEVLDAVTKDAGKTWDTLVIDPISVFYDVEKNVASANNTKDMGFGGWGKVNGRMGNIYNRLTGLNTNVIITARESVDYAGEGLNLKKIGVKPDADKKLVYSMDFVLHLNPDHSATVEKSRGVVMGKGGHLSTVSWSDFEPVANMYTSGSAQDYEDEEQAADRVADSLQDKDNAMAFFAHWRGQGLSDGEILKALKVSRVSEWAHGRKAADEAVSKFLVSNIPPAQPKNGVTAPHQSSAQTTTND